MNLSQIMREKTPNFLEYSCRKRSVHPPADRPRREVRARRAEALGDAGKVRQVARDLPRHGHEGGRVRQVNKPRPFNWGFRICLKKFYLSSVQSMSFW